MMRRREVIAGLGGAAVWPLAAGAQQRVMPVVGFVSAGSERPAVQLTAAFRQGLNEIGYVEGRNVQILYRWAENQLEEIPSMVADLVRRRVDVIFATAGPAPALAAKAATTIIPIVFQMGSDPVTLGLVASLNRPGGNITGIFQLAESLPPKRLQLLHELVPSATTIAYLINPATPDDGHIKETETAARVLGVGLLVLKATNEREIETAFATMAQQRVGAVIVDSDVLFYSQAEQLVALAARYGLPAIYHAHEITKAGGLMSYGPSIDDAWRLAGTYVGRILKGEKPTDLPVQQATRIELTINMITAKTLGLTFPLNLLGRADAVIE
jgi:putative tryptophan/tyrosine transport system substrate-binding protein